MRNTIAENYSGTTPVGLALSGNIAAAIQMINDPWHELTARERATATAEVLRAIAVEIPETIAPHCAVCEFSSEDSTPTLHLDLWRGHDLGDLPQVNGLTVAAEGHWDGGRAYSLQLN